MTERNEKKDVIEEALRKLVTETIRRNGFGTRARWTLEWADSSRDEAWRENQGTRAVT